MGLYLGAGASGPIVAGAEQGVMVLGPPRSGKTSTLVVPNVLAAPGAVVVTSTKADVLAATLPARARTGRCWLYDPSGTVEVPPGVEELRWSPLVGASTWDGALLVARAMVRAARRPVGRTEDDHWTERAEALLGPMLYAARLAGLDMGTVMAWVNRNEITRPSEELAAHGAATATDVLRGIAATDDRELSGIWSTASGVLAAYRSDAARSRSMSPNWDATAFVESADTVYVCAPGRAQELVAPLVVGFIEDVRAAAFARAAGPAVLLALDEVANIAPLPDLPAIAAEGGSQGLVSLICLQDLSQARARWGAAAEGFGSLFGATVVLPGIGDVRTLKALSELCGEVDVRVRSETRARPRWGPWARRRGPRTVTWSTRRQPRLGVDALAEGRAGCALVVGGGERPGWVTLTPWWAAEPWKTLAVGVVEHAPALTDRVGQRARTRAEGHDRVRP